MTALFNPSPLVLGTLQNLSLVLDRSTALARGPGVSGLAPGRGEARAFGGLDMTINRTGQSMPAKVRYGAITIAPRAQGSAYSKSPGVHPAIDRAYDNPGVRFGDRVKGGERPVSSAGETSCHFSQTSVSKTSPIREMIKAARSGRRRTGSRAAAHVLYVEREGAPEQIKKRGEERLQGEAFTAEIERRGMDRSAVAQQAYIERGGAAEGIERKPGRAITDEELDALDEASFGTIGDTVEERTRFWLAVEEAEATPKGDRITIKPRDNPEWWAKVAASVDGAPSAAQRAIRDALARDDGEPFEMKLPTDKAFAVHQWVVGLDTEAPLEISPGRGGRTQTRVIAELPHELDGRERLQIVRDFTQKLAEKGFPYWAVIHAPDANNDARNYHVHIAYYDRPAAKVTTAGGKEVWDFEILEEVTWKNRTKHLIRTQQQNRDRSTHDREWVTELRKHWETVSNRALEDAGVSKRYNLGTYESMGIELEPLKHINSRTFNKERKGELTEEGPVLARRQWDNVHDRMVKDHEARARRREASIEGLGDYAARLVAPQPYGQHRVAEVKRLKAMGVKASFQLALAELHQDLTRLTSDRIASRPKLIMNAADKEEQKTRKKRGLPLDAPPQDHPVAGAGLFGLSRRSEIAKFLTTIYDGALLIDRDNEVRSEKAQNNVRLIVQELKAWIAQPGRPLHHARRYSAEPLQDLDDPARIARAAVHKAARMQGFRESVERQAKKILNDIKETAATSDAGRSPHAAPEPVQTTADQAERLKALHESIAVGGETDLSRPEIQRASPDLNGTAKKPQYKPGRPEGEPRVSERPRERAPRFNRVLTPDFIQAARSPGAAAARRAVAQGAAVMPSPAADLGVSKRAANQAISATRPGREATQPAQTSRPADPKVGTTAVSHAEEVATRMPIPVEHRPIMVSPVPSAAPRSSTAREGQVAENVHASRAEPRMIEEIPDLPSSRIETNVAAADAVARIEPATRPPAANVTAPAAGMLAGVGRLRLPGTHAAYPAPAPSRAIEAPTDAEPAITAGAHRAAPAHTDAAADQREPSLPAIRVEPRRGTQGVRTPVFADVAEIREPVHVPRTKPEVEVKPPVAAAPKPAELTDVRIVGAQRPPKKRREKQRDRGRER